MTKAKAARPLAEWMITLAKQGDLAARRQAASYLLDPGAVKFLFEELSKRYATRPGGYTRLVHAGWRKGDGADVAVLELVDNQVLQRLAAKRATKAEARRKAAEEAKARSRRLRLKKKATTRNSRPTARQFAGLSFTIPARRHSLRAGIFFLRGVTVMGNEQPVPGLRLQSRMLTCRGTCGLLAWVAFFNDTSTEMGYWLLPQFLVDGVGRAPHGLWLDRGSGGDDRQLFALALRLAFRFPRAAQAFGSGGYTLANLLKPLLAVTHSWRQVFWIRFGDRAAKGFRAAPRDALIADSVDPAHRGAAFGFARPWTRRALFWGRSTPSSSFGCLPEGFASSSGWRRFPVW